MLARLDGLTQEIIGLRGRAGAPARLAAVARKGPRRARSRNAQAGRRPGACQFARQRGPPGVGAPAPRCRKVGRTARTQPHRGCREGASARRKRTGARDAARRVGEAGRPGGDHRRRACRCACGVGRTRRTLPRRALRHGPPGAAVPRNHQPAQRHRAGNLPSGRAAFPAAGRQHRARSKGCAAGRADHHARSAGQRDGHAGSRHAGIPARHRGRAQGAARGRAGDAGEAVADRNRPGAQAGRVEIPRRNQPQGTRLPGGRTLRRR